MEAPERDSEGRSNNRTDRTTGSVLGRAVLIAAGVGLILFLKQNVLPDVQRYLKMRSM